MDDMIRCPLVDREITCVECMENCDTRDASVPAEFKAKKDWRSICASCEHHQL